jgi:RHS repeat-associated protein
MNPNRHISNLQGAVYQYTYNAKKASGVCLQNIFDYSPFGAALDGRTMQRDAYRYGFNGKEKLDVVSGEGNEYDFGARMYNPRIGRWLSLDPLQKTYPSLSPYNFVANNPIIFKDEDGKVIVDPKTGEKVVKVDGTWKTASGGEVSKMFIKNSQPVLEKLTATKTGEKIYEQLQSISTLVTIDLSDKSNLNALKEKGSNSEWHAGLGEKKNADGLYETITITPSLGNIEAKAEASGVDFEEKFLQVMSVETGHIGTKEQIEKEKGFDNQTATPDQFKEVYNGLLNQAIRVGKEYRNEVGKPIDESSKIPITATQKTDVGAKVTLEEDNK